MRRSAFVRMGVMAAAGVALACGDSGTSPDDVDPVDRLVARLNAAGLAVTRTGPIDQPFFSVRGEILTSGQHQIQAFDFGTEAAALAAAASVGADGSTVRTTFITWVAPPHFYRSGSLLVLYVGNDATMLAALVRALGPQFAGR